MPPRRTTACLALLVLTAVSCRKPPERDAIEIAVPYEVETLDPHAEDKVSNQALLANLYEPLVVLDRNLKVTPGLATSWESPDSSTWVFHLRPSVTFHSGRPLRAADVAYSFNRILRRTDLEMRNYLLDVSEVVATSTLTVEIRTRHPARNLLNKLSAVGIIPEGGDQERLRTSADGTGPYSLAAWSKAESASLIRNDRYWGGPAPIRRVEFALGRGPDAAIRGLLDGRYQLIQCDSKKVEVALEHSDRYSVLRRDNLFVKYMAFDLARDVTPFSSARPNPFRDIRVRRAVNAAIDRHRLVKEMWGYAVPATQPVPRLVFGFNPAIPEAVWDRDEAMTLLKEAGLPKGFPVVLHARKILGEAAALIREDLGNVGIGVEVRILPDAEFFDLVGRRGSTLWVNRFGCITGDAGEFLDDLLHSTDRARHLGMFNYGGYASSELDRAIEASAGIEKIETRRGALQEILRRAMEDLIVIPLYNDQDVYALERSYSWEPRSDSQIRAFEISTKP